jgi:hypothetical protein
LRNFQFYSKSQIKNPRFQENPKPQIPSRFENLDLGFGARKMKKKLEE